MKILLIEPNYTNKYPPVGLMKIASYHTMRNDEVFFVKGTDEIEKEYERIYISTLFTFNYDITLETIRYYENKYGNFSDIYVGGIMASILEEKLKEDLMVNTKLLTGQLTSSCQIGFDDNVNIDQLPLDYNILYQIEYKYPTDNDYITYTSRGCTNSCSFCAVPKLEPKFMISSNLTNQVLSIQKHSGEKKNLLLLDNNILSLNINELRFVVDQIKSLGYVKNATFFGEMKIEKLFRKLEYLQTFEYVFFHKQIEVVNEIVELIQYFASRIKNNEVLEVFLSEIETLDYGSFELIEHVVMHKKEIISVFKLHDKRRGQLKFVDFNQGMDARQLTEEKMKILSEIPIKPFRLALDNTSMIPIYEKAVRIAAKYGVKYFSNYLLYNFTDYPIDMYKRLRLNIELAEELNLFIYSFPMKYADVNQTNRKNVGIHWNSYYLANFRRILKPTLGVVGRGVSYFENAFGKDENDFMMILAMPFDFVIYREIYKKNGIANLWLSEFNKLDTTMKNTIITEISQSNYKFNHPIMKYYRIRGDGNGFSINTNFE